jgi:hypothetical protein
VIDQPLAAGNGHRTEGPGGRTVLLLDSDPARLQARGVAMRGRGASVTCSTTAVRARSLWKPGSHDLVLIEFGGAGLEFEAFRRYARGLHTMQAFGFYTSLPPYLTLSPPSADALNVLAEPVASVWAASVGSASSAGLIAEASRRIAAIKPLAKIRKADPTGSFSFSAAVKAAERIVQARA